MRGVVPGNGERGGVEGAVPVPVLVVRLAAVYLPHGGTGVDEADRREDPGVVLPAGRPGDLAVRVQLPHVVPEGVRVLGLVHLDQLAVVAQGDRGRYAGVVPAVSRPGHPAVGPVPAGPVPERAAARVVHLADLTPRVDRHRRVVPDVPPVLRARARITRD